MRKLTQMTPLGTYIRQLRDKKEMSLREFARRLKKTAAFISDVELGRRFPSPEVLEEIAKLLGTSVEDLKKHDFRPPLEEVRKATESRPALALAFRSAVQRVEPETLQKMLEQLVESAGKKRTKE